jgi:hypothetical protein
MRIVALFLTLSVFLAACGGEQGAPAPSPARPAPKEAANADQAPDHGEEAELGTVTLAGYTFAISRLGKVTPGKECAFEVVLAGDSQGQPMTGLNLFLWVESKAGNQLSAPAKGDVEGTKWHFHAVPRAGGEEPNRAVLRVRTGGKDERTALPLSGHGHEHGDSPHHGVVAAFHGPDGKEAGHVELKLHDDKGDLELWIARDAKIAQPFDLPLDAAIRVVFIDHGSREVTLAVRDKDRNEDEDGTANIRDGRTNYFIFPGDSGQDATWLKGKEFQSIVTAAFEHDGRTYTSEEFVLVPHTHEDEEGS